MNPKIFILGGGKSATSMAEVLAQSKSSVVMADISGWKAHDISVRSIPETESIAEILKGARLRSCTGSVGHFAIELELGDRKIQHHVQHIILADDTDSRANFSLYGLSEGAHVMTLAAFQSVLVPENGKPFLSETIKRVVFLTGLVDESTPLTAESVMQAALSAQRDLQIQTYIFTGNLKVAGNGLEALYQKSKEAGVIFIKITKELPEIVQADDGSVVLTFKDEILRERCRLQPDVTVVDEAVLPSAALAEIAERLELETGPDGFIPMDNVHRLPTYTNRKGIWAIGPARGVSSPWLTGCDIAQSALHVATVEGANDDSRLTARIETSRCVRCLTCFRICPYRAVELSPRPVIAAAACEGCGICIAECPTLAIEWDSIKSGRALSGIDTVSNKPKGGTQADGFSPSVTVFCCTRSAVPARRLARAMGNTMPENLSVVEVPCAGGVSTYQLLDAFRQGADGVLIMGCHTDNCHSNRGALLARKRVDHIRKRMAAIGIPMERLKFRSVAANMGIEFAQIVCETVALLKTLGPGGLV